MTLPQTLIERFPAQQLNRRLTEWKQLRGQGWHVTLLAAPDGKTIIALACRDQHTQLSLLEESA